MLGRTNICYSDGYLAVYSIDPANAAEKDVIYVYDVSFLQSIGSEIRGRKVQCQGTVKCVSVANGRLAYIAQDPEDETKIHVNLLDLNTLHTLTCAATVLDLETQSFASALNATGMDAFTNKANGKSSQVLRLPQSPELFATNGRYIVFSASFLSHFTIWDMKNKSDPQADIDIAGKSFALSPKWLEFLSWEHNPDFERLPSISYHMSLDDRGDIYTTINGNLSEKECMYPDDRYVLRYACTRSGKPIRMKDRVPIPPSKSPEVFSLEDDVHVAGTLVSFSSAGSKNFFNYHPGDIESRDDEYGESDMGSFVFGSVLDLQFPRIAFDRKKPRRYETQGTGHPEDWESMVAAFPYDTNVEYELGYINRQCFWLLPDSDNWRFSIAATRVIPYLSRTCVIWHCLYKDEEKATDDGGSSTVRRVVIAGVKPTMLPGKAHPDADFFYGGNEDVSDADIILSSIPEPASACEVVVDYSKNRKTKWAGDEQCIVLSHYKAREVPEGATEPSYGTVVRLFRYGSAPAGPTSYTVQYA
ncbi:hypothetical protein DRE_04209 [Drechslerella stenobrocha 248]|uniref:Uncharacterized protein n=1 Tax=Drechslerella stenobrocha 248 TaxID=1043628 RepID=W7HR61_9PEZI|nr:hypothetical protein DRE_04209 [Drechslerella stenobrocha 248]